MNFIRLFVLINLLFLAKSAFSAITISPGLPKIQDCETVEFQVQGGTPPYIVTVSAGKHSEMIDNGNGIYKFTYTPPNISKPQKIEDVSVRDSDNRIKKVMVRITKCNKPNITPKLATSIMPNPKAHTFKVSGGEKPFRWEVSEGQFDVKSSTALYYPPAKIGKYTITVYDNNNQQDSAEINVVPAPILTPAKVVLSINQSITLKVSGGTAPYTWFAKLGQLSAVEGDNVTYTAPNNNMEVDTVTVMDNNGITSMAQVQVTNGPVICYSPKRVTVGELVNLAAAYGLAPYTWQDGSQGRTHQMTFNQVGKHQVEVRDAHGNSSYCEVNITGDLPVTPAIVYLKPSEQTSFVVNGQSQYTWMAESGSLSTLEGPQVEYIAPDQPGGYNITVTDPESQSQGIAVAVVTVPFPLGLGEIRSKITIDNIPRLEAKIMVDKNALADIKFIIKILNDPQEIYNIYAAVSLTQADTSLLLFITSNQMAALSEPFPVYKSSARSGEDVSINVFQGVITQLLEQFNIQLLKQFNIPIADKVKLDYFIGYRPVAATGLDKLIFNPVPYSLEIQ
jgi:hypothetical protein